MSPFLDEIEACIPELRRYARALCHDAERADDLVQDCLERAIRKQALFRPRGPLKAWLFRMMVNIHRNDLRSARSRPDPVPIDDCVERIGTPAAQPGRLALGETARAIASLPLEQREALLLVAVEGMSYEEAAGVLGIPAGTLMSRLGRAREALRRLTGEKEGPKLRTVR